MELTFGMLAVWLFIFYVERSIVKADGVPFLAIIFEAFGADLRPRAEAWFLAAIFLTHIFFGIHAMLKTCTPGLIWTKHRPSYGMP